MNDSAIETVEYYDKFNCPLQIFQTHWGFFVLFCFLFTKRFSFRHAEFRNREVILSSSALYQARFRCTSLGTDGANYPCCETI